MNPLPPATSTAAARDAELRVAYLSEVLTALFPAGSGSQEMLVLPHARRPRLLVPAGSGRVAAAAVRHATQPRSARARLARVTAATALRAGAGRWLLRDRVWVDATGSLEQHLRAVLDLPVCLAIQIGPARANRKPVAQLLDPAGRTMGFLKLGVGPLTQRLVQAETAALVALAGRRLRQVTVPQVWHAGRWRGHRLLVQSAVPVWRRRGSLHPARLALAMYEVAAGDGLVAGPLAGSRYWAGLTARVTGVAGQAEGVALGAALARLGQRGGERDLRFGAWHGDWAPWNMAVLPETLLVWDWERFETGVPLGFDAVHYDLQRRLLATPDAAAAVTATLASADRLLAPFDVAPAARPVTALLYLADLAARYLTDRQAEAGARLGVLGSWLLPVLANHLKELP